MEIFLLFDEGACESSGGIVGWQWVLIVKSEGLGRTWLEQCDGDVVSNVFFEGWKLMVAGRVSESAGWGLREFQGLNTFCVVCRVEVRGEDGCRVLVAGETGTGSSKRPFTRSIAFAQLMIEPASLKFLSCRLIQIYLLITILFESGATLSVILKVKRKVKLSLSVLPWVNPCWLHREVII